MNVVVTSQATRSSTRFNRAIALIARIAPNPPSVVADPPSPTMMRRRSGVECVIDQFAGARRGGIHRSLPSAPPTRVSPLARAISMTAVFFESRQPASTGSPSGPVTIVVRFAPPSASSRPSPPSAIGTSTQSTPSSQQAWPIAAATSAARLAVPLNLSSAATTRRIGRRTGTASTLLVPRRSCTLDCRPCRSGITPIASSAWQ